jgi:methionyl-tRNA formyltransferase
MRILFMGTPEFAKINLSALYESGEEIVGVVTTPDKAKGRGMVLTPSDVKKYALEKNLDIYQPQTLKDGAFEETLKTLDPELIVVVAYGRILPEYVLNYPKYGCINAHASILPKYRGAAPIQRAIIDGERETGVSVMRMDAGLDTGDVILVEKVTIEENDNFESVHDKLYSQLKDRKNSPRDQKQPKLSDLKEWSYLNQAHQNEKKQTFSTKGS